MQIFKREALPLDGDLDFVVGVVGHERSSAREGVSSLDQGWDAGVQAVVEEGGDSADTRVAGALRIFSDNAVGRRRWKQRPRVRGGVCGERQASGGQATP